MGRVTVSPKIVQDIQEHLGSAYPNEGCGFLLGLTEGDDTLITGFIPVRNERLSDDGARNRFLISPVDFRRAEATARRLGIEVTGTCHSHPDTAAVPSEFDREHALPWFRYLIVSVVDGKPVQSRVYRLVSDRSRFEELELFTEERQHVS